MAPSAGQIALAAEHWPRDAGLRWPVRNTFSWRKEWARLDAV